MGKQTPLYNEHVAAGAKIVDFGGWDMPLHYGSQLEEHHQVRREAGMFDVSHMTVVDLHGERCREFLAYLVANDVGKLVDEGKALYTCMLHEDGGIIDDLIVYYMREYWFRLVVNAATRDKDLAWIRRQAQPFQVQVDERDDLAMIAVQGPQARDKVHALLDKKPRDTVARLQPFYAGVFGNYFIARTGYTGEDGYEIMLPNDHAAVLWRALSGQGVKPIGLGARDTLRLEAGMNLYGTDMDESTTPLDAGLAWTVAWQPDDRQFIGRSALEAQRDRGDNKRFIGLLLKDKGVLRGHQSVLSQGQQVGEITSGTFSPTLGRAIAMARVSGDVQGECQVEIRGKLLAAQVVKPNFVRRGKALVVI